MSVKKNVIVYFVFLCLVIIFGYYSKRNIFDKNNVISKQIKYLNEKGYDIVDSNGIMDSFILNKEIIKQQPYSHIFGVQEDINIEKYHNKTIDIYLYTVKGHPLDDKGDMGKTEVFLIVNKEKIIGGYSIPINTMPLLGSVYSIDGKSLEEVTGLDYSTWLKEWEKKYNQVL